MTVIVTGGRSFDKYDTVDRVLSSMRVSLVVHGDCSGADTLAKRWAEANRIPHEPNQALWKEHGKAAGPIRNRDMVLKHRDAIVVAFPGDKGTKNCMRVAVANRLIVLEVIE